MDIVSRVAARFGGIGAKMLDAMDAAFDIVDGIDGMVSEQGDFPLRKYWRTDVLRRYDSLAAKVDKVVRSKRGDQLEETGLEVVEFLKDLIDGYEGVISEQGHVDRYWKRGVMGAASSALRDLKKVMR
jgi:hypothetical protein